ncbi:AAA family ATPase [Novosphingobium sp. ZN18A2]|uniref:AAA family ATPase n=1 Tax=Novosphingobium sp. ZN18A2 TaxID=3079861 RepID=UPI0030D20FA7
MSGARRIPHPVPQAIPDLLKAERRWVAWKAGPPKPSGKFDKLPVDPLGGHRINALDPVNWLPFDTALAAHQRGAASGIGIVLSDQHPINVDGFDYYAVAIDLDTCANEMASHHTMWRQLGMPYVEVSPSGKGLRMLGLSRVALQGGNAGDGRELYYAKRFVTVTGHGARGKLCDFTEGVVDLTRKWFPSRSAKQSTILQPQVPPKLPETKATVSDALSMLDAVSPDCDYETWRNIIWSLASTGWANARLIAHKWSRKALHRYDADILDNLFDVFDASKGITLRTLGHHARSNGWSGDMPAPSPPVETPQPYLMTADQLRQIPATPYLVRGVLPAHGLAAIYGESGSGKSFLALDLARAIAAGESNWFDCRVKQRPVVYVALEGQGGLCKRVTALAKHAKAPCSDQLRFSCGDLQLLTGDGIDRLADGISKSLGTGAVVIIDTLNQAAPGADENASQDMGRIIANAKRIAFQTGGLVVLVHHAGKDRSRGLRGHSSLFAAMDAVIEVNKTTVGRQWTVTKAKDDRADQTFDFDLVSYEVGQDEDGEPLTSCAVRQTLHVKAKRKTTGRNQKAVVAALRSRLQKPGETMIYTEALGVGAAALSCSKPNDRAKEAVDSLLRGGHLRLTEGGICLT